MNVKTLIHYLQQFPDDFEVVVADSFGALSATEIHSVDEKIYVPHSGYVNSRGALEDIDFSIQSDVVVDNASNVKQVVVLIPTE